MDTFFLKWAIISLCLNRLIRFSITTICLFDWSLNVHLVILIIILCIYNRPTLDWLYWLALKEAFCLGSAAVFWVGLLSGLQGDRSLTFANMWEQICFRQRSACVCTKRAAVFAHLELTECVPMCISSQLWNLFTRAKSRGRKKKSRHMELNHHHSCCAFIETQSLFMAW